MGTASEVQLTTLCSPVQIQFTSKLVIERQIPQLNVPVNGRFIRCAPPFKSKIGASFHGKATGVDVWEFGEIKIAAGEIKMICATGRIVVGTSSDNRLLVEEVHVIESDCALTDVEVGIESPHGLPVGSGIGEMDLSPAFGVGEGTAGLHKKIGLAENTKVISR